jgi:Vam6/Vps39-like protein vacuolar protein sorting-associated protein 39
MEELMRYLSDRRPKVSGALEALHITSAEAHKMPLLSAASKEDLFALPDAPLTVLTPEELVRFAQIVDTALFKSYLLVRPGLLAPLCRVTNWCEVSEVEEVLRAREVCLLTFRVCEKANRSTEILRVDLLVQWKEDAWKGPGSPPAVS